MIKILDNNYKLQAILKKAINPNKFEEINGENTLKFDAVLDEKVSSNLNESSIIELEEDYFDIAYLKKNQNEDGTLTVNVEAEHISYRLNDPEYYKEYFTSTGTPTFVLSEILQGTGFTVGTVEYTSNITYSAQEKKSRRQILMEFVSLLGGEVDFNKFEVSIVKHRGNTEPKVLAKGKNIKIVSKTYNKRETDELGNPLIAYEVKPIQIPGKKLALGDEVLLLQKDLGIRENLRIIRIGYNPYEDIEADIELANFISGIEDQLYRIETSTVVKEKIYNGTRIGPEEGFVAERSDGKVKTTMNATEGIKIESDLDGTGLRNVFFVNTEGRIIATGIDITGDANFEGAISGSTINIGNGTFIVDIDGNMVAKSGTFEGAITGATSIDITSDIKVGNIIRIGEGTLDRQLIIFGSQSTNAYIDYDNNTDKMTIKTNNIEIGASATDGTLVGSWQTNGGYIATIDDIVSAIAYHEQQYHL